MSVGMTHRGRAAVRSGPARPAPTTDRPGSGRRPGATISSSASRTSSSRRTSAAASRSSSCSGVRGPMIAEVTAGCSTRPGDGEVGEREPGLVGHLLQLGDRAAELALVEVALGVEPAPAGAHARPTRVSGLKSSVVRYLPDSQPPFERAPDDARPSRSAGTVGSTARSMPRANSEYGGCSRAVAQQAPALRPPSATRRCARPGTSTSRTRGSCPARSRSVSAAIDSSSGVSASKRCCW